MSMHVPLSTCKACISLLVFLLKLRILVLHWARLSRHAVRGIPVKMYCAHASHAQAMFAMLIHSKVCVSWLAAMLNGL